MPPRKEPVRILVVEDEYFIADDLVRMLKHEAMDVAGPASNEESARAELDRGGVDVAIVDINLDGEVSFAVAAGLRRRGVPFLFLTGYDPAVVPPTFRDVPVLQKPYDADAVLGALGQLLPPA
ncbi:response regulator [Sphingomonas sp. ac-8]|uniref:response regulator n=1 Tax=Sphingomonas sp. ac-8 TaxID=3242977 RepID=UPI003A80AFFD